MKLAVVQAAPCESMDDTLALTERYARRAAQAGCGVICFPECFLTGYRPENAADLALEFQDPALHRLSAIAAGAGIDILAGFMEKQAAGLYITQGLFRRDGHRACYRKTHLGLREQQVFTPADQAECLCLTDGTRIGVQLCVETHYPHLTQALALQGAQVIFAPHAVPRAAGDRAQIWSKYIPARSYDNRVYMVCCNLWDGNRFGGGCLVTGPGGETLASCFRDEPALLLCQVDLTVTAAFRDPGDRRSRHYYPARCRLLDSQL